MLSVASLLNPLTPAVEQPNPLPSPSPTLYTPQASPHLPHMKRQKLCKDEATFVKGKPQIEVNYWPCEQQDEKAAAEHRKYNVYPIGQIAEYCKHVPYRSEKKSFLMFQYTFQMPHDDKRQTVMWDYNIGLVRITPFFKALEYAKTTPARMLGKNPGLKEVCHSITGGSLAAQGYWMPFEAAKAVATTFCYRIRYVLTPIFGLDFPAQCIPPGSLGFESMHVAPKIIRKCIDTAQEGRGVHPEAQIESRPETPVSAGARSWTVANIRPKPLKLDSESGYGTDTDCSDSYVYSPVKRTRFRFKGLATPRSSGLPGQHEQSYVRAYGPSQTGSESDFSNDCRKRKRDPRTSANKEHEDSSSESEDHLASVPSEEKDDVTDIPCVAKESAAKALLELKMEARVFERKGRVTQWRRATA
ncbi:MAG: hypothetical protein Q9209_000069 [Squamulea sp. 1 TL-2023]